MITSRPMKLPWYIRQKPAVVLIAGLGGVFTVVNLGSAQPWANTTAPSLLWKSVALSADGARVVAAGFTHLGYAHLPPAPIFVSANAGLTWVQTGSPSNNWASVASSADGARLVAAASDSPYDNGDGLIYASSDFGVTWRQTTAPRKNWVSVAASADGFKLVAAATPSWADYSYSGNGAIYRSSDGGATWTKTSAPTNFWQAVASSADGTKLVAGFAPQGTSNLQGYIGEGAIYISLDSGETWLHSTAPSNFWTSVASSADGTKLVATATPYFDGNLQSGAGEGAVYISRDSGATWMRSAGPTSYGWKSVASSAEGTSLMAASGDGGIYISTNSGMSWITTGAPCNLFGETAVCSSADGNKAVASSAGYMFNGIIAFPYSGAWKFAAAPSGDWSSLAGSTDCSKLVAVGSGEIFRSADSGMTWSQAATPPGNSLNSVASSMDGTNLVGASTGSFYDNVYRDGAIYRSSDGGATWIQTTAPSNYWQSVASSADGAKLVAASGAYRGDGLIYISHDSGATWRPTSARRNEWIGVASSSDGTKLTAVATGDGDGLIYTSTDSGANWLPATAPSNDWATVASSADGTKLVAAAGAARGDGLIYASNDSGTNWRATCAQPGYWHSVVSSSNGTKLAAIAGAYIIISTNSGATWMPAEAPAGNWKVLAMSADGTNLVALSSDGFVCILNACAATPPVPPPPLLDLELSGTNLDVSWLVPSTPFVLEQSSELCSTSWAEVPTSPTLDFTNLHYRVRQTASSQMGFYHLKQQ